MINCVRNLMLHRLIHLLSTRNINRFWAKREEEGEGEETDQKIFHKRRLLFLSRRRESVEHSALRETLTFSVQRIPTSFPSLFNTDKPHISQKL